MKQLLLLPSLAAMSVMTSCTITHHWQLYDGPPRPRSELAILTPSIRGFHVTSINGWVRRGRYSGKMAWNDAYDLTPGHYTIVGSWDWTNVMPVSDTAYKVETRAIDEVLHLDARAGHTYVIVGGQNLMLPGYVKPQIKDTTND